MPMPLLRVAPPAYKSALGGSVEPVEWESRLADAVAVVLVSSVVLAGAVVL